MLREAEKALTKGLTDIAATSATELIAAAAPYVISATTLWFMWVGYRMIMRQVDEPFGDLVNRSMRVLIVVSLGLSSGFYIQYVVPSILGIPKMAAKALTSSDLDAPYDKISKKGFAAATSIFKKGVWYEVIVWAPALLVVLLATLIATTVVFLITITINVSLALVAVVGPVFIAFALFEPTRSWFMNWLGMVVNLFIYQLFLLVLTKVLIEVLDGIKPSLSESPITAGVTAAIQLVSISFVFVLIPTFASALTGGAAAGAGGETRIGGRMMGGAGRAGMRPVHAAGRGTAAVAKAGGQAAVKGLVRGARAVQSRFS